MSELSGKVALITGASSGIGRATALYFAARGSLLALFSRNLSSLEETKALAAKYSKNPDSDVLLVTGDVTSEDDCENVVKKTVEHFHKLDILVNAAGTPHLDNVETVRVSRVHAEGDAGGGHFAGFDKVLATNVRGPLMLIHFAAPHLIETKGTVVNVSSITSTRYFPNGLSYSVSKAALDHLTRCCALELAPKGVRVNAINPAFVPTGLLLHLGLPPDVKQQIENQVGAASPLHRVMQPEEVAEAIFYLVARGSYCVGVCLPLDAGASIAVGSSDDAPK